MRRAAFAGAALCLALALVPAGANAQEEAPLDLPESFGSSASAEALGVELLTPALVPVPQLFAFGVAEGRGSYEPANQEARASLFFPGNGGIRGPSLACGEFGRNFPPESEPLFGPIFRTCLAYRFPLAVFADSLQPDGQTEGAVVLGERTDPVSLEAVGARAHAGLDATTTDAEVQDLRIVGAPAFGSLEGALTAAGLEPADATIAIADGLTATTDQRVVDGALVVESVATVDGLRLLGGLVRIGSIVSRSVLTSTPGEDPVTEAGVEVAGIEVAGTPMQLTDGGLVAAGSPSGPLAQQVASQVADALADSGFELEVLPVEQGEADGIPFATAGGVVVEFSAPIGGLPPVPGPIGDLDLNGTYGVRLQLGTTGVRGFADEFGSDDSSGGPLAGALGGGAARPGGLAGPTASPAAGAPSPAPAAPPAAAPSAASPGAAPGLLADVLADRLPFLYASFTLAALALCLAPKLTLPARLPGAR